jgi:hypothetical protein
MTTFGQRRSLERPAQRSSNPPARRPFQATRSYSASGVRPARPMGPERWSRASCEPFSIARRMLSSYLCVPHLRARAHPSFDLTIWFERSPIAERCEDWFVPWRSRFNFGAEAIQRWANALQSHAVNSNIRSSNGIGRLGFSAKRRTFDLNRSFAPMLPRPAVPLHSLPTAGDRPILEPRRRPGHVDTIARRTRIFRDFR